MFFLWVLSGYHHKGWLIGDSNLAIGVSLNARLSLCVSHGDLSMVYVSWDRLQLPRDPELDKQQKMDG